MDGNLPSPKGKIRLTLARMTQAGVVPIDTLAVISEVQKTWNRADAREFANVYADYMMPNYRLLIESYDKAQSVQKLGRETQLDRLEPAATR